MANRVGTFEVDPISRIEGHLGIKITSAAGGVTEADAHGNLWRGFENFLLGRKVDDAITFTQRICGVCPVPHGLTATYAADNVNGYSAGHITFAQTTQGVLPGIPKKAVLIRNLVLGAEFLMSSITHFYHLAAPSYIQGPNIPPWTPYFADSFYGGGAYVAGTSTASMLSGGRALPSVDPVDGFSLDLWSTVIRSYVVALRIRRLTFEAGALFAGRMPMTSVLVSGGVTFNGKEDLTARANQFQTLMAEVGRFVIQEYVPIALALSILYPTFDNVNNAGGLGYGGGLGRYLAWGGFPNVDGAGTLSLPGGKKDLNAGPVSPDFTATNKAGVAATFLAASGTGSVKGNLTEDIAHSRYAIDSRDNTAYGAGTAAYPGNVSRTKPNRAAGYSYMKAPRWAGQACEVGPMARMFVAGFFADNATLVSTLGAYYTQYTATNNGNYGLDPAMIHPDIAVVLLKAGLATVRNTTVANALTLATTTDFTYAMIVANLGALQTLLGTVGAHDTLVAAYSNADTVITGAITTHVLGIKAGKSTMDRLRGRAVESLYLVQEILGLYTKPATWGAADSWAGGWIGQLKAETGTALKDVVGSTWTPNTPSTAEVKGWGGTEAPRGALMHQVTINGGKITKYQCIVPTTWNGSPKDTAGNRGAIEQACIGAPFSDAAKNIVSQDGVTNIAVQGGVEILRIAQSFDPCIACAIH